MFTIGFFVPLTYAFVSSVILLSAFFFPVHPLRSSGKAMESPTSSVSTASSFGENFAHNMWNPLLELLFHEQRSGVFVPYVEEVDLAQIALSCFFALDVLCYNVLTIQYDCSSGTMACGHVSVTMWHHCHTCNFGVLRFRSLGLSQPSSAILLGKTDRFTLAVH